MSKIKVKDMVIEINASIGDVDYTELFICDILSAFSDSLMDAVYSNLESKRIRTRDYLDGFIEYINNSLESEENKK